MQPTLYEILGVKIDATIDQINAAVKVWAKALHPDINKDPEAAEAFKLITLARVTLTDSRRRMRYDASLISSTSSQQAQYTRNAWYCPVCDVVTFVSLYIWRCNLCGLTGKLEMARNALGSAAMKLSACERAAVGR